MLLLLIARGVAAADEGFKPIFDGKTLQGWDGDPKLWRVEDGAITGQTTAENPTKNNTFLIWRGGKPADFELKLEFRMPNAGFANSGVQYRSREEPEKVGKWVVGGYQADMDGENQYTGILYDERGRGILALRGQKTVVGADHKPKVVEQFGDSNELAKVIKKHDWNEYHIIARGNHLIQKINGQLMIDVTDNDPKKRQMEGILALQIHAGEPMKVQFRNIRLKEIAEVDLSATRRREPYVSTRGSSNGTRRVHEYFADRCRTLIRGLEALIRFQRIGERRQRPVEDAQRVGDGHAVVADRHAGAAAAAMRVSISRRFHMHAPQWTTS